MAKKFGFARLDKHSFFLKIAALTAKTLCVVPILNLILLIIALVLGGMSDEAEQATANMLLNNGNLIHIGMFYVFCLPAMVWGFLLYYYDALFVRKKKGKKRPNTKPVKIILTILVFALLIGLATLFYLKLYKFGIMLGLTVIGLCFFTYWGFEAGVKSYSEVLSTPMIVVIACIYIFYLLFSAFISVASSASEILNAEPVVLGVVLFGALGFIVMNQATIDYEMQNQDAESTDARRGIQKYNFKISLILVALLAVLFFTRKLIASFLVWLAKCFQNLMYLIFRAGQSIETPNFDDVSKDYSVGQLQAESKVVEHEQLVDNTDSIFLVAILIFIAMIIIFRKPILKAMRKSVKWLSKLFTFQTYSAKGTSQYYRDLVEEIDEDEADRLFASDTRTRRTNRQLVKDYDKLTDPNQRVRRALPVMRKLFGSTDVEFTAGDTVRDTARRIDAKSDALKAYTTVYEDIRYDGADATPAEAEAASQLVHGAYEQVKDYQKQHKRK